MKNYNLYSGWTKIRSLAGEIIVALIIAGCIVFVALCVNKALQLDADPNYVPRIYEQESRQMIKEIHEHLIGE